VSVLTEGLEALKRTFERAGAAPAEQWRELAGHFRAQRIEKGRHWLAAGEQAAELGFVVRGVFRLYYTAPSGKESNKSFVAEGEFLASLHSLIERVPSRLAIQSLTDADVIVAPYALVASFYERDMFWQRARRLMAERLVVKKLGREASLLMDSAQERYSTFLREHESLAARVPDHHVARYLGITPEALSRLRRARTASR
jgi:CRP/FNR family transcriptional regulator, anaerobic regulatory protein